MSWLDGMSQAMDSIVRVLSPKMAMERNIYRHRDIRLREIYDKGERKNRSFEATSGSRTQYDFLKPNTSADSAISGNLKNLRNHVRQAEYDNGHVAGPIARICDNVVGTGLRFQSRLRPDRKSARLGDGPRVSLDFASSFNAQVEYNFKKWSKQADVRLLQNFYELQYLIQGALIRDGEVLVIGRQSKKSNRLIPYCQEVVEIDRLDTPPEEISNPQIRNGIRFDEEGAPVSYFVLKYHPADYLTFKGKVYDFEEIPAFNSNGSRKVIHLYKILRPEQTRGFSWMASGLKDLQNALRYADAEMFAAIEDACMTGIVTSPAAASFQSNYTVADDGTDSTSDGRIHEFAPNKWHYLNPGEEVSIRDPKRPNDKFDEIIKSFYRGPANGLNIPLEVYLQDWKDLNYSNARTILIQFYQTCRLLQQYMVDHYCLPTYENVLNDLVIYGKVQASGYVERQEDYLTCKWTPPKREWVDPLKEPQGKQVELQNLTTTRSSIVASQGGDFEEVAEEVAQEEAYIKGLEEEYGVDLPGLSLGKVQDENDESEKTPSKKKGKVVRIK